MLRWFGIDLHKNFFQVCILDESGRVLEESRHSMSPSAVDCFRCGLTTADTVVMEASALAWPMYDLLVGRAARVIVVDPYRTKLISQSRITTDRLSALRLAQLAQDKHLVEVWVPDAETRAMRELVGFRQQLTKISTKMSNISTNMSRCEGLRMADPGELLVGTAKKERAMIGECARQIKERVGEKETLLDAVFAQRVLGDPRALSLLRVPGVGPYTAVVVLAAAGDIKRFGSPKQFASYTGMVPRLHISGETSYSGRITKAGRRELRHALIQAAWAALKTDRRLAAHFDKLAVRRGEGKAIVAIARKLAVRIWHLLTEGTADGLMAGAALQRKVHRLLAASDANAKPPRGSAKKVLATIAAPTIPTINLVQEQALCT
jgi:transposase